MRLWEMQFTNQIRKLSGKKTSEYPYATYPQMVNNKDDNTVYMVNTSWEILLKQQFAH